MNFSCPQVSRLVMREISRWVAAALFVSASAAGVASVKAEAPSAVEVSGSASVLSRDVKLAKETSRLRLFVREGSLLELPRAASKVFVATPGIASYQMPSPDKVFFFGQAVGTTTFYALDDAGQVIASVRLNVEHNLTKLKADVARAVPNARIELEPALNGRMIVRGTVKTAQDARRVVQLVEAYLSSSNAAAGAGAAAQGDSGSGASQNSDADGPVINQLKVELSSQVNIQVRVVEVSRSLTHQLGFNWASAISTGRGPLYVGTGNASGILDGTGISSLLPSTSTGGFGIGGKFSMGRASLSAFISALSQEGFASLLAEPNLTAMTGQPAAFASGGEVPVVIVTGNSITIDYKSYGVILRMVPTVLSPNRISLHVAPEVSELTSEGSVTLEGGSTIPALRVRRAETTVEMASGQSFALAGMLRSASSQQISGVPGLRHIPFLGRLFEYEETSVEDSELVILVTANIVDPVAAGDLRTPGKGMSVVDAYLPKQASIGYLY